MKDTATMEALIYEVGAIICGLSNIGHEEQLSRIFYSINTDFYLTFPKEKEYFMLFSENRILRYFAFGSKKEAEEALIRFEELGDSINYRIVPRVIAEMIGREHEFYQYRETMADSDAEAVKYANKQQEIIDFLFSSK